MYQLMPILSFHALRRTGRKHEGICSLQQRTHLLSIQPWVAGKHFCNITLGLHLRHEALCFVSFPLNLLLKLLIFPLVVSLCKQSEAGSSTRTLRYSCALAVFSCVSAWWLDFSVLHILPGSCQRHSPPLLPSQSVGYYLSS